MNIYVFRATGRLTSLSVHIRLDDQSSRLLQDVCRRVANSIQPIRKFWRSNYCTHGWERLEYAVLERVSSLGFNTFRKLALRSLKIRLQNYGSVNVFKSSYTSWRPVFETGPQDGYEDVLQTIFNRLEKGVKLGLQYVYKTGLEDLEHTSSERRVG